MSDPSLPSQRLARRLARWLLGVVLGVTVLEWGASALAYRVTIEPADWKQASVALAQLPAEEPVWLATPWLGPRARMHLPRMASFDAVAAPDLRGAPRFHVLGRAGDQWSTPLQADLEDLPAPTLVASQDLGGLQLSTYEQPSAGRVLADFVTEASTLTVSTPSGPCRGRGRRTCEEGRVGVAVAEVDYRPRRCLRAEVRGGTAVTLRYPQMPVGDVLRGHVAFDDFNARLRSDAPVRLRVLVDGQRVAQWLVGDEQGWWPFAVRTEPGVRDVELQLVPAVRGTWQRGGYEDGRVHAPCVELRSLQEGAAP